MMKRRHFSAQVLTAGLGALALGGSRLAQAQGATPAEGVQYVRLSQPQPVQVAGKIEVLEFFWYGCPHCNDFEPLLSAWVRRLPPDVAFRRVPVAFREEPFSTHQKIYYSLETMGQVDAMQRKVFYAIHVEHQRLEKPAEIAALMQKNGIDSAKFMDIFNSFGIAAKLRQARSLAEAYRIDGLPALGVNGQYYTSGSLSGSLDNTLAVADYLIQKSRKG